jgi:hypothetical protein
LKYVRSWYFEDSSCFVMLLFVTPPSIN